VRRTTSLPGKQVLRGRYGEKVNLPTWQAGLKSRYKEKVNFLPGEQLMRSRYGEKFNLPTWRAGYEEQIW
jgi:hypothetical protein